MLRGIVCLVISLILFISSAESSNLRTYTVILGGNKAGRQITTVKANGLQIDFEFNDRGRGPKLISQVVLDEQGLPRSVEVTGNDYFKGKVEEQFSKEGSKASWKNQGEQGSRESQDDFYIPMNGTPEDTGLLASALWNSPKHTLGLLPDGSAAIERIEERVIAENGRQTKVFHYSISGLDFLPFSIWLAEDQTFFASVSSWYSTIREGWESAIPQLLQAQEKYNELRISKIAQELPEKHSSIAFRDVAVFDSVTGSVSLNQTVIVSGNRISKIGPAGQVSIPEEAKIIEGEGKTLLPGLWDMHVHLGDADGLLHLASGVTTVRDLANDTEKATGLQKKFASGEAIGPRVILAGFIDGPGPYAGPSKVLVDNETQARDAIDKYASLGYQQIKIYSSLKRELVPFIIEHSHSKGLRVSGHIPAFMTAEEVVKMGLDEIQHANFLFLNFLAQATDTRTPLRFTAVAERAARLDLQSEAVQSFLNLLKEKNVVLDPTLNVFESLFTDRPGTMSAGLAKIAHRLPPQNRRAGLTGGLPVPDGKDLQYREAFRAMQRMIKNAFDKGIVIVAGTDSLAGFGLQRELELYVQAGIPASNALQMATIAPARVMKKEKDLGSIAPGKIADMILVGGNPVTNIGDIRNIEIICKEGILFHSTDLYRAVGVSGTESIRR